MTLITFCCPVSRIIICYGPNPGSALTVITLSWNLAGESFIESESTTCKSRLYILFYSLTIRVILFIASGQYIEKLNSSHLHAWLLLTLRPATKPIYIFHSISTIFLKCTCVARSRTMHSSAYLEKNITCSLGKENHRATKSRGRKTSQAVPVSWREHEKWASGATTHKHSRRRRSLVQWAISQSMTPYR